MSTEPIAAGPNDVTVRAQFEHWMSDEGKSPDAIKRGRDGLYKYAPAASAWITWKAAAKAEREACAKACEALWREEADAAANGTDKPKYHDAIDCAAAIRARSNAEVRGASRLAGEASSAEGATSTVVLGGDPK